MYDVSRSLVKKIQILEKHKFWSICKPTENLIEIWKKEATTLDFDFGYLDSGT
jgi:hypothetical protein